jgi:hypothetical protein
MRQSLKNGFLEKIGVMPYKRIASSPQVVAWVQKLEDDRVAAGGKPLDFEETAAVRETVAGNRAALAKAEADYDVKQAAKAKREARTVCYEFQR